MRNSGFTLIEFLIYIAILAVVVTLIIGFFLDIILGNIKETSYQEVQQNARFILTKISQEVKKATGINSPNPGESASALSLAMASPSSDPTLIDVIEGKLRLTKGISAPQELTTDLVEISNLRFTNLSYPDTPGTIRIEMTISHINPANRIEYQASIDLKSTVSLVQGGAAP